MKILKLEKTNDLSSQINSFISSVSGVDVKQTPEWLILRDEESFAILLEDSQQIICYCNVFKINQNEAYIPRGPIVKDEIYFDDCLLQICEYLKKEHFSIIRFNPKIKSLPQIKHEMIICDKHNFSCLMESYREAIVYLDCANENEVLMSFRSSTRRHIRNSLKENLETEISNDLDIDEFYQLYLDTSKRHCFKPHPQQYFKDLLMVFKNKLKCCKVKFNNSLIAASINILQGDTVFYLYGASSSKYLNLNGSYLMHWLMIKFALNNAFKMYNFGGVFAEDNDLKSSDYGLLFFKSGFCRNGFTEYSPDIIIKL